ncbi:MAG TPA: glycosyltransferase family 2 protein [Vicinamibacterales bacterium]|nr:glycosyltransferase family 2 protein [Vicinamibacterales bacterium]
MSVETVSVVVLTFNEAENIAACLDSVRAWAAQVFVVDSGSTDDTVALAEARGAVVVTHPFETHAAQWQWALSALALNTPWVLALDADQRVTPALADSLARALEAPGDRVGFFLNRRQIFRGRWIKHGGYYPKYLLKLFRRDAVAVDPADRVDHHFRVTGPTAQLAGDLVEDNRNEARISEWIAKHNRYARLQALEEIERAGETGEGRWSGNPDERTARLKGVWRRLPPYLRPAAYFFYRYIVRLGFLDGKEGFVFHFLQAWWYRLLVDINLDELKRR